jgi:phosphatidylserine synthase
MEILVLDALLAAGALVAARWAKASWTRGVPLLAALTATVAFVLVRDRYDLEDSHFLWALAVTCFLGATAAGAGSLPLTRSVRMSAVYALLSAGLVPVLFGASIAFRYSVCLVIGCDQS